MADQLPPDLVRRGFAHELENERRNCVRAVQHLSVRLAAAQLRLDEGQPPVGDLRTLVAEATEAYQRAAAWAALERVKFMLPSDDETKEGATDE